MVTAGRKRTPDGRRVIFGIKLSEDEAARCDAVRGGIPRSEWGRALLLAACQEAAVSPRLAGPPVADSGKPQSREMARSAPGLRRLCPHPGTRTLGGWCGPCGVLVEPGGYLPQ